MFKKFVLFIILMLVIVIAAACSENGNNQANTSGETTAPKDTPKTPDNSEPAPTPEPEPDFEPVTLSVMSIGSGILEEEVETMLYEPVRERYPHITLEYRGLSGTGEINNLIVGNDVPDIIFTGILDIGTSLQFGLPLDLNPLLKKHALDLNRFIPVTIEQIEHYSSNGELFALPWSLGFPVLYYNKEIFDKFAVGYPEDGLTWDEAVQLANNLTREDHGVQYKGLGSVHFARTSLMMLAEKYDFENQQVTIQTDAFRRALDTFTSFMLIPGNEAPNNINTFLNDRTVAMSVQYNQHIAILDQLERDGKGFDWDITNVPTYPDQHFVVDTPMQNVMISSLTPYQDDAFRVIDTILSDSTQLVMSRAGRPSALDNDEIRKEFGQGMLSMQGKNIEMILKYKHAPINRGPDHMADVYNKQLNDAYNRVIKGEQDVNSALRQAEETIIQQLEGLK